MECYFKQLKNKLDEFKSISSSGGLNGFLGREVLRFHSIAGTLLKSFECDKTATVDERYITHILSRSILENYFWLIYLYDNSAKKQDRYNKMLDSFKRDYYKLMNEPCLPHKDKLEPSKACWCSLNRAMDVKSMLAQVKNDYGDRLSYLYFVYRISSFDTHGKNLDNILQEAFGKKVIFPILKVDYAVQLMANQYLITLQQLKDAGEI
jgi:hypothetical protein